MARFEEIPVEDLEEALVETGGYREVQRLNAVIIYKRGPSVPMIAEWLDKRGGHDLLVVQSARNRADSRGDRR